MSIVFSEVRNFDGASTCCLCEQNGVETLEVSTPSGLLRGPLCAGCIFIIAKMRDTPRATPARTGKGRSKTVKSPDHLEEDIPAVTIDLLEPAKNGDPVNTA